MKRLFLLFSVLLITVTICSNEYDTDEWNQCVVINSKR